MRHACALIAAAILASPALAGNESRVEAFATSDGLVEVVADFSEDAIYWCGAAEWARSNLPAQGAEAEIYVWRGPSASRANPGETAVLFGYRPPPEGKASVFTGDVEVVGNSMSVAAAAQTCNERSASG